MTLQKIISGGQTGVDRGALSAALSMRFPCGGWCTKGRKSEDGKIPEEYPLIELPSYNYRDRTEKNVIESDGTLLIVQYSSLSAGSRLTKYFCEKYNKPFEVDIYHLSLSHYFINENPIKDIIDFVVKNNIKTLNIAGTRASKWANGYTIAFKVTEMLIKHFRSL